MEVLSDVRLHDELAVLAPDRGRDGACVDALVELRIHEADRERAQGLLRLPRREARYETGIEAPGEQHGERNVGTQVERDGVLQSLLQRSSGVRLERPEPALDSVDPHVAGRELAHAAQTTCRPGDVAEREVVRDGPGVDRVGCAERE